jgi:hypothetical protein
MLFRNFLPSSPYYAKSHLMEERRGLEEIETSPKCTFLKNEQLFPNEACCFELIASAFISQN